MFNAHIKFTSDTGQRWLDEERLTGVLRNVLFKMGEDEYIAVDILPDEKRAIERHQDVIIEELP